MQELLAFPFNLRYKQLNKARSCLWPELLNQYTRKKGLMNLSLILVADYANVTREGKLNVMGIFREIKVLELEEAENENKS